MPITHAGTGGRRAIAFAARPIRAAAPKACAALVFLACLHSSWAAERSRLAAAAPTIAGTSEWLWFNDSQLAPVRVVRGTGTQPSTVNPRDPVANMPMRGTTIQIVSFGTGRADAVKVVRGIPPGAPSAGMVVRSEARPMAARLLRLLSDDAAALFTPSSGDLDRIAFAVDGIESRHGADLRMWRPEPLGPQGPMQITAAAAFDVGGGNRFDMQENRLLGRAYLARMYRRYGNWSDALSAYNWGPGNLDAWVAAGRPPDKLPDDVARYVAIALRDALISLAGELPAQR